MQFIQRQAVCLQALVLQPLTSDIFLISSDFRFLSIISLLCIVVAFVIIIGGPLSLRHYIITFPLIFIYIFLMSSNLNLTYNDNGIYEIEKMTIFKILHHNVLFNSKNHYFSSFSCSCE